MTVNPYREIRMEVTMMVMAHPLLQQIADYPPETIQAVLAWSQGNGRKPKIDHITHQVTGYYEGPGQDFESTMLRIRTRRQAGDPNHVASDSGVWGGPPDAVADPTADIHGAPARSAVGIEEQPSAAQPPA